MILTISGVAHDYGPGSLFDSISTSVNRDDRIVLIGKNGSGKSTLLKIISGEIQPTEGSVFRKSALQIGHQRQRRVEDQEEILFDHYAKDKSRLTRDSYEFYSYERRVRSVLSGLGFKEPDWERNLGSFSGGEITRIVLGKLLLFEYDLLLLDEPTNHLDLDSVDWLVSYLKGYKGAMIVVSHDRYLIRSIGNRFWEINSGRLWDFSGGFSVYSSERERMMKTTLRTRENLEKEIDRLSRVAERYRAWGEEKFIKQAINKERQVERLKTRLESAISPEDEESDLRLRLRSDDRTGYKVLELSRTAFSYDGNPVLKNISVIVHRGEKMAILGPNGSGKTTLLKIITGELQADKGTYRWGHNVRWSLLSQTTAELNDDSSVLEEAWKEVPEWPDYKIRSYLGRFGFELDEVFKAIIELSGGERTKLALAITILKHPNVLIMDEPTNNLDIWSIENLEKVLKEYGGALIIVSHDRDFLRNVCDRFVEIRRGRIVHLDSLEDYQGASDSEAETSSSYNKGRSSYEEIKRVRNRCRSLERRLDELRDDERYTERQIDRLRKEVEIHATCYERLVAVNNDLRTHEDHLLNILLEREELYKELESLESELEKMK